MNFNFLASFLLALALFSLLIRRNTSSFKKEVESFWSREEKSNFTRKKPLDDLEYITIPKSLLEAKPSHSTEELDSYWNDLCELANSKIVNLTGYTNTDLKLKYGTANITVLTEYDFHYTNLVTLLQKIAERLVSLEEKELAQRFLEFSISIQTDVSKSYYLLASLYQDAHQPEKINYLIQQANQLHSIMKDSIVRNLKASGQ